MVLATIADMRNALQSSAPDGLALTGDELAKLLRVSRRHIYTLDQSGKLPRPVRLGHAPRWVRSEIESWLAAGAPPREQWEAARGSLHGER